MKKSELRKIEKEEKEEMYHDFCQFMFREGFKNTIDKQGNFAEDRPLFYRKVNNNDFFTFNITYYGKSKTSQYTIDFSRVKASDSDDFLMQKLESENIESIKLSFNFKKDIDIYYRELKKK